jgi:TRAP transporter TAXI family solute receptor
MDVIFALVLGTATPGGGFPLYGDTFAEVLSAREPRLRMSTRNTKGSSENVPLLEARELDLALVLGEYALGALAKPQTGVRLVSAMYSTPGMVMVRAESPYRGLADLAGKPVVLGTQGSGITVLGRTVFQSLGIEIHPILLEKAADGPPMLLDGRAQAIWGAGAGWPAFTALANSGARFIAPDERQIARILEKNRSLQAVTLAAKSYPGQDAALASVGSWSYVLARPGLPDEAAYLIARALDRAQPQLAARLEQARESTLANTLAAAPRRDLIHPGVLRYLAEAGFR